MSVSYLLLAIFALDLDPKLQIFIKKTIPSIATCAVDDIIALPMSSDAFATDLEIVQSMVPETDWEYTQIHYDVVSMRNIKVTNTNLLGSDPHIIQPGC